MKIQPKLSWQLRVRQVNNFHLDHLKVDPKWRIEDTARELNRSIGRVSEDLMLAEWIRVDKHRVQLEKMKYINDALLYVRKMKRMRILDTYDPSAFKESP